MNSHALTLHGETLRVGSRTWSAHLLGAQTAAGLRCVRLALHGVPTYTVLLKISSNPLNGFSALAADRRRRTIVLPPPGTSRT